MSLTNLLLYAFKPAFSEIKNSLNSVQKPIGKSRCRSLENPATAKDGHYQQLDGTVYKSSSN